MEELGRAGEMEIDVLARGDGYAVASGGVKTPRGKDGHDFLIETVTEAAEEHGSDYAALCVDGDFNDNIAFQSVGNFVGRNLRLRAVDGKGGFDFLAKAGAFRQRSIRRAGQGTLERR